LATAIACVLLPMIEISLAALGLRPTLQWLTRSAPQSVPLPNDARTVTRRARLAIDRASRNGMVRGRCLSQSLALWWILRRYGVESRLKLGAVAAQPAFDAHAWLENESGIINDSADVNRRYPASFAVLG